jgi:hypothetical protein
MQLGSGPFRLGNILLLLCAMQFGKFLRDNPMLYGEKLGGDTSSFVVYAEHPVLDEHLEQYANELGEDYMAYRNHCLRVLSFAGYHLGESATDKDIDLMALALAYHDIALWSDGKLDYLEPSAAQLERKLQARSSDSAGDNEDEDGISTEQALDASDLETARAIILMHHKYTAYTVEPGSIISVNAQLVNAVRKGDWADATMGIVRYGLPAKYLEAAYEKVPDVGFHWLLVTFGGRLSPESLLGQLNVLKIFKW